MKATDPTAQIDAWVDHDGNAVNFPENSSLKLWHHRGNQITRSSFSSPFEKYSIPKPSIKPRRRDAKKDPIEKFERRAKTKERAMAMAMAISRLLTALVFFVGAATVRASGFNVSTLAFEEGYSHLFGEGNLVCSPDGRTVRLVLNRYSGAGFISSDRYHHGLFSASIKLPSDYTAGVVVAFYTSNGDIFPKTHDELDFEFLGNIKGEQWRIQTNVYGNGSTSRGREERYILPFDPTREAHRYSILWTSTHIMFYIDNTPIREVVRSDAMGGDYPSKPMSLYATIWDGSTWATSGGKYKVKYKYAPFVAEFSELVLHGCRVDPIEQVPSTEHCTEADAELMAADFAVMTPRRRAAMRRFRERYMTYSVCYDTLRYPNTLPDCDVIVPSVQERFWPSGHVKFPPRRRRSRRHIRMPSASDTMSQPDV